ncbi:hypothetical protein [Streptomyces sp. NPDC058595]|uniref:hypothetical protein n=1 Tax=Streptomyces sp. NPDC058595 TaxID=3346550 RepID=UPI003652486E
MTGQFTRDRLVAAAVAGVLVCAVTSVVLLAVHGLPDAWWPRIGDVFDPVGTTEPPCDQTSAPDGPFPARTEEREAGIASVLSRPAGGLSLWQALPAFGALVFIAVHTVRGRR